MKMPISHKNYSWWCRGKHIAFDFDVIVLVPSIEKTQCKTCQNKEDNTSKRTTVKSGV